MGFQAMSHRRNGDATFLGYSGYSSLSGIIRSSEITALADVKMLKKRTQVSNSRPEKAYLALPLGE
jgi:hypothetical protein